VPDEQAEVQAEALKLKDIVNTELMSKRDLTEAKIEIIKWGCRYAGCSGRYCGYPGQAFVTQLALPQYYTYIERLFYSICTDLLRENPRSIRWYAVFAKPCCIKIAVHFFAKNRSTWV